MNRIFVSYRRSAHIRDARAIYERLAAELGRENVFIDLEGISPGQDFVQTLDRELRQCKALVVLIGPQWVRDADANGVRRIDRHDDFVRLEIMAALERRIPIIPVLLDGATHPSESELPDPLRPLARRQSLRLDF